MKKLITSLFLLWVLFPAMAQDNAIIQKLENRYGDGYGVSYEKGYYQIRKSSLLTSDSKGRYGLCNDKGVEILPVQYEMIYINDDGYLEAKLNDRRAIFDMEGKMLLDFKYERVYWYQIRKYNYAEVILDGKSGLIDHEGHEVVPCKYDDVSVTSSDVGYVNAVLNGKTGTIDLNDKGKVLIPFKYDRVLAYQLKEYGYCEVESNGKVGVVDASGKEIVPCLYEDTSPHNFRDGDYMEVTLDGKKGVVDKKGQLIIPCLYKQTYSFHFRELDYCEVFDENDQVGVYDKEGKLIVPVGKYQYIMPLNDRYKAAVVKGAVYTKSYFDENYKWIKGSVATNGKWGLVDLKTGKELIPCKYEAVGSVSEDLATFNVGGIRTGAIEEPTTGGKWGYVTLDGKEIIPAQYDQVSAFSDGCAQVQVNGIASIITNPLKGTTLRIAQGGGAIIIDDNIPASSRAQEEVFAFIIANENYYSIENGGKFAIHDGQIFSEYCKKTLGIPEKNIRYFEDATYGNIVNALSKIEEIASVYDGDAKFILYFAGLGATDAQTKARYLLPVDASIQLLQSTGIEVSGLIDRLGAIESPLSLLIMDAPFSNEDRLGKALVSGRGVQVSAKTLPSRKNVGVIDAAGAGGAAFAADEFAHGLLTYAILKHLQDTAGNCTIQDICTAAERWVQKQSLSTYDKVQAPKCELGVIGNIKICAL